MPIPSAAPSVTGASAAKDPPPVIGVSCCTRMLGDHPTHWAGEKYVLAVSDAVGGLPLLVPALGERIAADALIGRLDGLLLTGSRSNVEPHHYGGAPSAPDTAHDPQRDAMTLPLIRAAVAANLPLLAICRGFQELNVALGGTLHQRVHEVEGRLDHRAPEGDVARRYAHEAHAVALTPGGALERLAGSLTLTFNSLHSQGIDRLAPSLAVEAVAPDGQIEAVRHEDAAFALGVQWHPEYRFADNLFSRALFAAFGAACRVYSSRAMRSRSSMSRV
jgi:putative glutamine amidotransferase